jgi:glyoxylase-like metal-dependent hydrolase (beta-lactamase superfamily II)
MDALWGEFLPVPEQRLSVLQDGEEVVVNGLKLQAVDTPGHAEHHFVYLFEDICFSGDIGGVRLSGTHHIRLPMPPPELHLGKWRQSLKRLEALDFNHIAPTHFGVFSDKDWHLTYLSKTLDETEAWIESTLPADPPVEVINQQLITWIKNRARRDGVPDGQLEGYESANPSWMSGYGIQRYWRKYRQ